MCELFELKSMMHFICGYIQENWDRYMKDMYEFIKNIVKGNIIINGEVEHNAENLAIDIYIKLHDEDTWNDSRKLANHVVANQLKSYSFDSLMNLFNELKHIDEYDQEPSYSIIADMIFIWSLLNGQTELPDLCTACFDDIDFDLVSADDYDGIVKTINNMKHILTWDYFKCCEFYDFAFLRIDAIKIGIETYAKYSGKDYNNTIYYIAAINPDGFESDTEEESN